MSDDLIAVATQAVAAAKDAPPDLDAAEAVADAGDVVGTRGGDGGDGDAEDGAAAVVAAESADPAKAPADTKLAADPTDTDDFDAVPARDATGRTNRIPHPRVRSMVDTAVRKATSPLVDRLTRIGSVEQIMFNDKPRFIEMLKESIPGYRELLSGSAAAAAEPAKVAATTPAPPEDIDWSKAPAPDGEDGSYTATGLQKLLAFTASESARMARTAAVSDAEARIAERYKPIEDQHKAQETARKQEAAFVGRVNSTLEDGRSWKFFAEHEDAILQALTADSAQAAKGGVLKFAGRTALRQAYEEVVFGKLTTDRQKQREELIAEMKGAPRSTSAGSGRSAAPPETEPEGAITSLDGLTKIALAAVRAHRGGS